MNLKDKVVLVCGAAGNLGPGLVAALLREGAIVCAQYRERGPATAHDGSRALWIRHSLDGASASESLMKIVIDRVGRLDIMINTIGDFLKKDLALLETHEWRQILESNLSLCFDLSQAALPHLRVSGSGKILFFGYAGATSNQPKSSILPYQIAKSGLVLLTKALASTEARYGVRVNCLSPGVTEISHYHPEASRSAPPQRPASSPEICEAALFLLRSDYLSGQNLEIGEAR